MNFVLSFGLGMLSDSQALVSLIHDCIDLSNFIFCKEKRISVVVSQ